MGKGNRVNPKTVIVKPTSKDAPASRYPTTVREFSVAEILDARFEIVAKTANYDITDTDKIKFILASGSGTVIKLPNPNTNVGRVVCVKRNDAANNIVVARYDVEDIENVGSNLTISVDLESYAFCSDGTDWWIVYKK